jgi:hypothetical protein
MSRRHAQSGMHIVRRIRLMLKTGYLKKEPPEYTYLCQFPSLSRDNQDPLRDEPQRILPYEHLYHKAIEKNPLFVDEKVYPAYYEHEPSALILAKKQYNYMHPRSSTELPLNEEEAYVKAAQFVQGLEEAAYDVLYAHTQSLKDAKALLNNDGKNDNPGSHQTDGHALAIINDDKDMLSTVNYFRSVLREQAYEDMSLADLGEIDYFIQTRVLQWHEVCPSRSSQCQCLWYDH